MRHLSALTAALLLALSSLSVSADTIIQPSSKISYQDLFSSNVCTSACDKSFESCIRWGDQSTCQSNWNRCKRGCSDNS